MDLLLLGKDPVFEDQPAGSDIRYEESFEALQGEVEKMTLPSATSGVDWEKVVAASSEILARKSKDLLVASYLAVALIHTRQVEGFSTGLRIYRDILEQFWDDLYPPKKRMRARMGAVEWWLEKSEAALQQVRVSPLPEDQLHQIKEDAERIDQFLRENLEDPPILRPILGFVNALAAKQVEDAGESVPSDSSMGRGGSGPSPAGIDEGEVADITSTQEAMRSLSSVFSKMRKVATFFWENDLSNPLLYRLDRVSLWLTIENLPPSIEGRTRISPPPAQVVGILRELQEKGEGEALLKSAEGKLSQFIFWMDLNRLVAEALSSLGDTYQEAHEAVCQETTYFIRRFPEIENLSFSDGTPFADTETKQWLKEISFRAGSGLSDSVSLSSHGTTTDEEEMIRKEILEAQSLIKEKKLVEAIEHIQEKFRKSLSERERLLWRVATAQLFLNTKNAKLTLPHLEQILKDLDRYRLEEFDPPLALKCLKLVWHGFSNQPDQDYKKRADEALQRIAKLDMAEGIRLERG